MSEFSFAGFIRAGWLRSFLVALSGGVDSVALLEATHRLGLRVRCIHVDHRLHSESGEWAAFCRAYAEKVLMPGIGQ